MQGINCIKGEIHNVLTVLRLNSQSVGGLYSGSEIQLMELEEQQLIRGLKELYEQICMQTDLAHVDTLSYLTPFLTVITSKHTDIFTTAIALHSIHKFLVYGLIHAESPNVAAALTQIADSVTHCTFDVTDGEDAEVVSMKILEILLECLRCSAGEFLTDQAVLDMVVECFHVRSQQHSSKLLRRYAENVLMQMVLVLFARISPESSNATELYHSRASSPSPMMRGTSGGVGPAGIAASPALHHRSISGTRHRSLSVHSTLKDWSTSTEASVQQFNASTSPNGSLNGETSAPSPTPASSAQTHPSLASYGIPALHRVFRFLTNLINPGDVRNTEQDRILGLRLIRTVLETSSTRIGAFPPLIQVIQEELCKYLLQNSQSKNLFVLSLTLRIVFDLFITVKTHLKVQLEVFFTSIHLRIGESPSSTFQQKELVLESLVEFCKEVSLIVGLYRNYDCELGCTDLFQDLGKFLSNMALQPWNQSMLLSSTSTGGGSTVSSNDRPKGSPPAGHPNQLAMLALEGMVAVLNAICKRFCSGYGSQGSGQGRRRDHLYAIQESNGASGADGRSLLLSRTSTPSLTASNSFNSFTSDGIAVIDASTSSSSSNFTNNNEEDSTLLILNPEEERFLQDKRANKQKLALAAQQFNREGLTLKCVKYLQGLQILPPSSEENDPATVTPNTAASAAAVANNQVASVTVASAQANGNGAGNAPAANGEGDANHSDAPATKKSKHPKPPPKSKHDPGIPPMSIVQFFRQTPGLDKVKIGEYLGDSDPYNIRVLDAFVESFDFSRVPKTNVPNAVALAAQQQDTQEGDTVAPSSAPEDADISLDDALRTFLDGFKLPGESQQIARIIERFSNAYFAHCKGPLKSADAAYVLCYSVIMLNTDAHNSQVTRKMTKEMYCKNLRGINEREDLPREYLEKLYDSIVHNEIKIKSDNIKDLASSGGDPTSGWSRVVRSGAAAGDDAAFQVSAPRSHGREMFLLVWQQCVSVFVHYLESQTGLLVGSGGGSSVGSGARDGWLLPFNMTNWTGSTEGAPTTAPPLSLSGFTSTTTGLGVGGVGMGLITPQQAVQHDHLKMLPKIVQGFSLCCRICAVYNLNDIMNNLIISLCKSLISFFEELCIDCSWEIKEIQLGFARDIRIAHLLQLLFSILHEYGEIHILEGWSNCVHVLLWLRQMELLPSIWIEMEDFRDSGGKPLESVRFTSQNPYTPNPHRLRAEKLAANKTEQGKSFWTFWRSSKDSSTETENKNSTGGMDGQADPPVYTTQELYWIEKGREIIRACNIPALFEDSRYFRPSTLAYLVRSLILISSSGTKNLGSIVTGSYSPHILHEESAVFCLERLADVIEKNQARLNHASALSGQGQEGVQQDGANSTKATSTSTSNNPLATPTTPASPAVVGSPNTAAVHQSALQSSIHLWSTISAHLEASIANVRNDEQCTFYIERLVVNLLRFSVRLVYSKETTTQLIKLLALLLQLSKPTFAKLAQRIIAGTSLFLQTHGESISKKEEWEVVFSLLLQFKHHPFSAHSAFQTFTYVVENHCTMDTFAPLVNALTAYAQPSGEKDVWLPVAPEAVLALLLRLHSKLCLLAPPEPTVAPSPHAPDTVTPAQVQHLSPAAAQRRMHEFDRLRTDAWLLSVMNFCKIVKEDERSSVRKAGLEALNNSLLAAGVSPPISPLGWKICFEKVLIPLLEGVQRFPPEPVTPKNVNSLLLNAQGSKDGKLTPSRQAPRVEEAALPPYDLRLKAATLVFQTFLHHLDVLAQMSDFHVFWLKFVGSMERYMKQSVDSGRGALSLHFAESLKNLLLVMYSSGIFATVSEKTGQNLLALTWAVIDSFRPELRVQLQEHMKPLTVNATTGQQQQQQLKGQSAAAAGKEPSPPTPQAMHASQANMNGPSQPTQQFHSQPYQHQQPQGVPQPVMSMAPVGPSVQQLQPPQRYVHPTMPSTSQYTQQPVTHQPQRVNTVHHPLAPQPPAAMSHEPYHLVDPHMSAQMQQQQLHQQSMPPVATPPAAATIPPPAPVASISMPFSGGLDFDFSSLAPLSSSPAVTPRSNYADASPSPHPHQQLLVAPPTAFMHSSVSQFQSAPHQQMQSHTPTQLVDVNGHRPQTYPSMMSAPSQSPSPHQHQLHPLALFPTGVPLSQPSSQSSTPLRQHSPMPSSAAPPFAAPPPQHQNMSRESLMQPNGIPVQPHASGSWPPPFPNVMPTPPANGIPTAQIRGLGNVPPPNFMAPPTNQPRPPIALATLNNLIPFPSVAAANPGGLKPPPMHASNGPNGVHQ